MSFLDPQHPIHPEHIPLLSFLFANLGWFSKRVRNFVKHHIIEILLFCFLLNLALTLSIFLLVNEIVHLLEH